MPVSLSERAVYSYSHIQLGNYCNSPQPRNQDHNSERRFSSLITSGPSLITHGPTRNTIAKARLFLVWVPPTKLPFINGGFVWGTQTTTLAAMFKKTMHKKTKDRTKSAIFLSDVPACWASVLLYRPRTGQFVK